jgi:hypothetical protein
VSSPSPLARIPVGVVVERRKAMSRWVDFVWQPVAILCGWPDTAPWTVLSTSEDHATYYAGPAEIELYRTETEFYRDNLESAAPSLWVALRPTGVEPPYSIAAVTADPAEGESFTQAGNDLVDAVPMPQVVREVVAAFVAEHHLERSFEKRKRDSTDDQALARHAPGAKDDSK